MSNSPKPQLRLNNDEIRAAMKRLNLATYKELATYAGISKATIERAVSGARLSGNTLAALSHRLNIPLYVIASPVVCQPQDAA